MYYDCDPNTNLVSDEGNSEKRKLIDKNKSSGVHITNKRWLILSLGSSVAFINGFQNLQFAGCEVQAMEYFKVSFVLGDLLTQAYYISFVVLAIPILWMIMQVGLRFTVQCAAGLEMIATIMTVVSITHQHLYALALGSQFVAGIAQVFILCYPSMLARAWFPQQEVSTASGTIVFFYQLGNGLALLVPPLVINGKDLEQTMGLGPVVMFSSFVGFTVIVCFLTKFCFAGSPQSQDGNARIACSYRKSVKNLMGNCDFILLFFSYGIDVGIFGAETSLFKAVLMEAFLDISDVTTGQMVAFMILVGTAAPLVFGMVLDKTKKYVGTLLFIHVICIFSTVALVVGIECRSMSLIWFGSAVFGLGFTGKMSVGLETAAEIFHPEPECASSGLLMWSMSIFTTVFIQLTRYTLEFSNTLAGLFIAVCSILSFIFTCFMRGHSTRSVADCGDIEEAYIT